METRQGAGAYVTDPAAWTTLAPTAGTRTADCCSSTATACCQPLANHSRHQATPGRTTRSGFAGSPGRRRQSQLVPAPVCHDEDQPDQGKYQPE